MSDSQQQYQVSAERQSKEDLEKRLVDINVLSSDLLTVRSAETAERLMYLAADVAFTLRMEGVEKIEPAKPGVAVVAVVGASHE